MINIRDCQKRLVDYCMMIEIAQMALSYYLKLLKIVF